jgi:hypothetical protein
LLLCVLAAAASVTCDRGDTPIKRADPTTWFEIRVTPGYHGPGLGPVRREFYRVGVLGDVTYRVYGAAPVTGQLTADEVTELKELFRGLPPRSVVHVPPDDDGTVLAIYEDGDSLVVAISLYAQSDSVPNRVRQKVRAMLNVKEPPPILPAIRPSPATVPAPN